MRAQPMVSVVIHTCRLGIETSVKVALNIERERVACRHAISQIGVTIAIQPLVLVA